MIDHMSDQCYKITFGDKLNKQAVNNSEKKIAVNAGNSAQIESLGKLILENIAAFKPWVENFHTNISVLFVHRVLNLKRTNLYRSSKISFLLMQKNQKISIR